MKALEFQGVGRLGLVDVPVPRPGPGQLLVRTGAAVICTSDINELRTGIFGAKLPIIFGHEGAGTVAQIGPDVKGFKVGDRVATHPVHSCHECENCRAGMEHLCARMRHFGLNIPGTFAEYYIVDAERARTVPATVPFEPLALAEPISVCLQALAQARVSERSRLLILGDGPFGILISILARSMKVGRIVVAGSHDFRLRAADADETVNIRKGGEPKGPFDAIILAVGKGAAVQQGLALLRPKGRLVIFSAVNDPTPIDLLSVHIRELEIVGACNDEDLLDEAVRRLSQNHAAFARIITHRFPLERYSEAFDMAANHHDSALKVAFTFGQEP
ncbi:zinc-dependent alcohol dehydrogenase [Fontivita pretiosa]|uniref:zinc-dependent alcohol dehydrogenase n=1 Tax=Fontivita pretiosa TaxID=2989684 RepID=UPI003D17E024